MNIDQAKQEIFNALRAYHLRDNRGNYRFPVLRQRPILLMGPPGIGKTAILEQVAREAGVGLVSYALTHHTRQSAVGLPHIEHVTWGGEEMSVTEYTMSEILASVYQYMEKTGKKEGILFLDEVNCVSETLAPTMLGLLQNKTFGSHRVPEGWMIVAAGNPPAYNKSVREFDVATLDRVRTIPVEPDCETWLRYAADRGVHGAILSYLSLRPEQFYRVEDKAEKMEFVTARGWEDLSRLLLAYEELELPVSRALVQEYLQQPEIAAGFEAFYQIYRKNDADYDLAAILEGDLPESAVEEKIAMAKQACFEERFAVVRLLLDGLQEGFCRYDRNFRELTALRDSLLRLKQDWGTGPAGLIETRKASLRVLMQAGLADPEKQDTEAFILEKLAQYDLELKKSHGSGNGYEQLKTLFAGDVRGLEDLAREQGQRLSRAIRFAERCFGEGQEMVLLMTDLARNRTAMAFLRTNGNEDFLRHSGMLQFRSREKDLMARCRDLAGQI